MTENHYSPLIGAAPIAPLLLKAEQFPPYVSIVIATYNMAKYVTQAVQSILDQEKIEFELEVIVVDDGSTDNTQQVLTQFAADDRVRLIRQSNQGQARAKNAGIEASRGTFVGFCDADDYWLAHKLSIQIPLLENNLEVGVVCSPTFILLDDGNLQRQQGRKFYRGQVTDELFKSNIIPFGTAVVRRKCLEELGAFDESLKMGIDWELWLRISVYWKFDYIDEPTYVYRIWDGQMSKNWKGRYEHALRIMDDFLNKYNELLSPDVVKTAYADTYTNLAAQQIINQGINASLPTIIKAFSFRWTYWPTWQLILFYPTRLIRKRFFF